MLFLSVGYFPWCCAPLALFRKHSLYLTYLLVSFPQQFVCTSKGALWEMKFWVAEVYVPFKPLGHYITSKCETENSYQNKGDNGCYLLSVINLVNLLEGKRVVVIHFTMKLQCVVKIGVCFHVNMAAYNTVHYLKRFGLLPAKENKRLFLFWYWICVMPGT